MLASPREKSRFELPFTLLRGAAWLVMRCGFSLAVQGQHHLQGLRREDCRPEAERPHGSSPANPPPEPLPGLILAGNHTGYLDSLVMMAGINQRFRFLMTHEVFEWPWVGRWVPYANILPIAPGRERRALGEAVKDLQRAGALCIFPEGRLSQDGELGEFQGGVALLQQKSGAPIVPFAICGGFTAWPEGQRFPRFGPILLVLGEPILPEPGADRQGLTQLVKARVQALLTAGNAQLLARASGGASRSAEPQVCGRC